MVRDRGTHARPVLRTSPNCILTQAGPSSRAGSSKVSEQVAACRASLDVPHTKFHASVGLAMRTSNKFEAAETL